MTREDYEQQNVCRVAGCTNMSEMGSDTCSDCSRNFNGNLKL